MPIPQGGAAVLAYDSNGGIFTIRADGTDRRRLVDDFASHPTWSPDGKRIAYRLLQGGKDSLVVMDAGGANPVTVDERAAIGDSCVNRWSTTWSPDGTSLIFPVGSSCQGNAFDLYIVPTNASAAATRLVSPGVSSMLAAGIRTRHDSPSWAASRAVSTACMSSTRARLTQWRAGSSPTGSVPTFRMTTLTSPATRSGRPMARR